MKGFAHRSSSIKVLLPAAKPNAGNKKSRMNGFFLLMDPVVD